MDFSATLRFQDSIDYPSMKVLQWVMLISFSAGAGFKKVLFMGLRELFWMPRFMMACCFAHVVVCQA
jgi:hypothetical protein